MAKIIRIGTRDSELALWQATTVQKQLEVLGHDTALIPVKSTGDLILDRPLYELGVTGIFTKALDIALLEDKIDIAVHSMKDVPTQLPEGVVQTAVLERAISNDILVHKGLGFLEKQGTIATGSLRRKAQWLNRYPEHSVANLRGNVNSRLIKLIENPWDGAIFAQAGLERIKLMPKDAHILDWMLPAPAQGAMMVVAKDKDIETVKKASALNHTESELCTTIEREFLRELEGGCTAPIGALAQIKDQSVYFKGGLFALDGTKKVVVEEYISTNAVDGFGQQCARKVLAEGGSEIMKSIRDVHGTVH